MIITLTNNTEFIYVNITNIVYFCKNNCIKNNNVYTETYIQMIDNHSISVEESPEEILNLIKGTCINV